MFDIHRSLKLVEKLIIDNSPTILTAVGVVGTVATGYFSHKAGVRTGMKLANGETKSEIDRNEEGTITSYRAIVFLENWRNYVPVVGVGALTVSAVVGANRISASRTVALAAAYALTQDKHEEYRKKVHQIVSGKKVDEIETGIAQDGVNKNPPPTQVIFAGSGEVMFKDSWSGRYFMSDMESIRKAVNDVNFEIRTGSYCSLTSFYRLIGMEGTFDSDEIGWNDDTQFDVTFKAVEHNGKPIMVFDFDVIPIRGYYQGHA